MSDRKYLPNGMEVGVIDPEAPNFGETGVIDDHWIFGITNRDKPDDWVTVRFGSMLDRNRKYHDYHPDQLVSIYELGYRAFKSILKSDNNATR